MLNNLKVGKYRILFGIWKEFKKGIQKLDSYTLTHQNNREHSLEIGLAKSRSSVITTMSPSMDLENKNLI